MSSYLSLADQTRVPFLLGAAMADAATIATDAEEDRVPCATTADRLVENLKALRSILLPELDPPSVLTKDEEFFAGK